VCQDTLCRTSIFLHPVGSACLIVHSGASGARNVDALFFLLGWAQCGFHKKCIKIYYTELMFLYLVGFAGHVVDSGAFEHETSTDFFHARIGPVRIRQKAHWDTLCRTCIFVTGGICGSHSAFSCIRSAKHRRTIFHARVTLVQIS
jgi:hypothetical protein